ncbi:MAG: thioredoxin-related protein [Vicingaceae bacterium]|jgi:thioredoxin-related protein
MFMNKLIPLLFCIVIGLSSSAQEDKIEWLSFEEALARNEKEPKKFIVDVYTDWCGWCKKMDANTFTNPVIIKYITDNYWAVKLNAERKDTVILGQQVFINENLTQRRGPHQLAVALLNGKMTYPSIVYLDENVELMHPAIAGYQDPKSLEEIIKYFGEGAYQSIPWDKYVKEFESAISVK